MTIIRSPRAERNFTILSNTVCLDSRLSMKGLGLLVRLLSRPDNWKTNSEYLAKEFGCGRDQIRSALQELQEAGYMLLQKNQSADGKWSSIWVVFDVPETSSPAPEKPTPGKPTLGEPTPGKPYVGESDAITRTDLTRTENKDITLKSVIPTKPEDVDSQTWQDWLTLRKAKKAPVTKTVLAGAINEAQKSGLSLQRFLEVWCSRGSQGLQASWLRESEVNPKSEPSRPLKTFAERDSEARLARVHELTGGLMGKRKPTEQDFIDMETPDGRLLD